MAKNGRKSEAVVLLSAGLDSTYNLLKAREKFSVRTVLTFDYGQKAALREVARAAQIARHFQLPHEIIKLPWFTRFTDTSLVGSGQVPAGREIQIDSHERSLATAKAVWVPNRNGIFLNIAAGFAEGSKAEYVIPGFNLEESQTFPDNSTAFLTALEASWSFSTSTHVRTFCFSGEMTKSEIVADGIKSNLPFAMLWPCYLSGDLWCGECESCQRFRRALEANGLSFENLNKGEQ